MKFPIYTEKTICRDCYKCVRQCPVKAIKVNDGSAVIVHDLCIFCGRCIEVCPVNAKKVRSDTARAKQLLKLNETVIASIAPSFPAEFDCTAAELITAIKKLGFSGVSETSIGAEIVGKDAASKMDTIKGMLISSACPTVKELIRKYRPSLVPRMADTASPLEAHASLLKNTYGKNARVVFIGPCISKKLEADDETSDIDLALTFIELTEWLEAEGIELGGDCDPDAHFIPEQTVKAAEFAVEGGMLNTIRASASAIEPDLISCSGISNIIGTFDDIENLKERNIFLEYLACDGGCISGRGMSQTCGYLEKRLRVLDYQQLSLKESLRPAEAAAELEKIIPPAPVRPESFTDDEIEEVLLSLDKRSKEDEMNCGGCGYNTCRDFAAAILSGKAEQNMCVTNMRKLAEKKSNALMKAMPLGVVITDVNEKILECNEKFINLFTDIDSSLAPEAGLRLEGAPLERLLPGCGIFDKLKNSPLHTTEDKMRIDGKVFRTFAFRIGKEEMFGAVFQDITSPAVRRETIIRKTEEVIEKSLNSVQQIASLLGENAAETQLILNSLIESYTDNEDHKE
ncbi:MAG: [Fe-Fe] hydrogenase large subunit C-terminal domain-containing protein [Spirochaetales bacterium]|uniref:[Fe-Fe] hydrogenase large subunit C-terminal domain-containing protein n=1 Tax=Candidatus Thalassospirochaeta sargassi TaxID=3119039 RepID=A0AAJ1MPI2_9SPIO|nr:[Fe-Fe] hydrogenase large subunit C-terminal domain-containing protein [Spirochaetales bacterium]